MEENRRVVIVISDMLDPTNDMVKEKFEWIWTEKIAEPDNNLAKSFIRYSYFTYEFKRRMRDKKILIINYYNQ